MLKNKKVILMILLVVMLSSSVVFAEEEVIAPKETVETYLIRDYTSGEDFRDMEERYNLKEGRNFMWFANFGGVAIPANMITTIEEAIYNDYRNGENLLVIQKRYGLKHSVLDSLMRNDEPEYKAKKTIMEAMYYDWKNGIDNYKTYEEMVTKEKISQNYEEMKARYGVTDEFIYWNFEDTFPEKLEGITVEQAIMNDWLMGTDYNKIKERFEFNDVWFKQTFKTVGRKHIELK